MIEDQHQVPISMYPLDIKCHQHLITTNSTTGNGRMLTDVLIQPAITEALTEVDGLLDSMNNSINNNNNNNSNSNSSGNNNSTNNNNINNSNNNNNNNSNSHNKNNSKNNSNSTNRINNNCGINCGHNSINSNNCRNKCSALCSNNNSNNNNSNNNNNNSNTICKNSDSIGNLNENRNCISINGNCEAHHNHHHTLLTRKIIQCGYCCQPICDRYIMRVVDTSYHENCLKCSICSMHLINSCFSRDGKLYCRLDYERLFIRNRCLGCGDKISSDELVMRTLENVFHLKCFACVVCGVQLKKGEQYVVKQGQLFCRFDYEKEVEMLQGYDFYGDDLYPPKLDGRRGPKRPRTILNTQQRRAFKASFEVSPKPCRKVRENLAKDTGLSLRIVQVWFQNQRAKVKKIQKKAKQDPNKVTSETDSQESDSSLAKIKDENLSDSESLESHFSLTDKARLIKEEIQNENLPFNCALDKENCNKTSNEPILNQILGLSYSTFQQIMSSTAFAQSNQMLNPIDRLYSMQNSYFRPEEYGYADNGKELNES